MYDGRHIIITAILLLSIASAGGILTRYLRIPYASMLVIIGLFVGIFRIFPSLKITPSLIYYVFLPVIIFEGAVNIKMRPLISNILPISMLSVFGTIISAIFAGTVFHFALNFPIKQSLIFGAIITPTDPISILALLKSGVKNHMGKIKETADNGNAEAVGSNPENSSAAAVAGGDKQENNRESIETLLTGESLFNDGISLVLFEIFLNGNLTGLSGITGIFHNIFLLAANSTFQFLYESIGGSIVGIVLGYGISLLLYLADDFLTEIMISLLLAYASLSAAYYLHMSFIMAIITSGIVLANYGFKNKVTARTVETFPVVIEYLTFIINSLLFLIIGIEIDLFKIINLWSISLFIIILALISRFIAVYCISPFVNIIKNRFKLFAGGLTLNKRHKRFLVFGGLKGALPVAMALSLPFNLPLRNEIITYVFIAVLFSLTVQAISFDFFIKKNYKP
jgi:CPA1 family monovalent cation:H+ antiporter